MRRAGFLVFVVLLGACSSPAVSSGADFRPGAPGAGDPYFPTYGNGGYDVTGYEVNVRYDPAAKSLNGTSRLNL